MMKNDTYATDADPIQRWFFKPTHLSIKEKLNDFSHGALRPIDDYTYGKDRPKTVNITEDPYFSATETREKAQAKRIQAKLKTRGRLLQAPELATEPIAG